MNRVQASCISTRNLVVYEDYEEAGLKVEEENFAEIESVGD